MISSEHRRSSDDKEQPGRQSLPSISEVISGARPSQYPPSQSSMQPGLSLPSPFPPASRQFAEPEKHSPQPLHTASSFPSRQENMPAFAESPRLPFNARHSLPPVIDRRSTPPTKSELPPHHRLTEPQPTSEPHTTNGAYGHAPAPPPPTSHPYPPGHLPPGQVPLPTYPISPRNPGPPPPGHYDPRGAPMRHDEADYANRARFEHGPTRHFETWNYQDSLSRVRFRLSLGCFLFFFCKMLTQDLPFDRLDHLHAPSSILLKRTVESRRNNTARIPSRNGFPPSGRSMTCSPMLI